MGRFSLPSTFTLIPAAHRFTLAQTRVQVRAPRSDQILISKEVKAKTDFRKDVLKKDGFRGECKRCCKEYESSEHGKQLNRERQRQHRSKRKTEANT